MNSDCAFQIGKTHRVCQDYAAVGAGEESAFVLLADGCSSSPNTDIGARLLVKSAERLLPGLAVAEPDWELYHETAIRYAAACARSLDLRQTCLDATLLTVQAAGGAFTACCSGDGVVVLGRQEGGLEVHAISYAASYPNYASYRLDSARRKQWEAQPENEKQVRSWALGSDGSEQEETHTSRDAFEQFTGTAEEYRFVAVLSDGIQSFTVRQELEASRSLRPVSITEILPRLLAFKGSRGQFVQRRVTAFLKECAKRHWQPSDDFSLGVVWLGD